MPATRVIRREEKDIKKSEKPAGFTSFDFPEIFFRYLNNNAFFPYWVKCVGLFVLIYLVGIAVSFLSNTFYPWTGIGIETSYSTDYAFLVVNIVAGITLSYFLFTIDSLEEAFLRLNKRLGVTSGRKGHKTFDEFMTWMKQGMPFGRSFFEKPFFWYYLETVGGAILAMAFAIYWTTNPSVQYWGKAQFPLSCIFFIAFCAMLGYSVGALVFVSVGSVKAIRRYCRDFVSADRILALNPDSVGGLRPIGQFSLRLDVAFALPSFVIFVYLVLGVPISDPSVIGVLVFYTIILVVIFFIPLNAAHDAMKEAKEIAFDRVNDIFKDVNSKISLNNSDFSTERIKAMKEVHFLYKQVSKMAVWPLNLDIILKFIATSSLPVIGSLIVNFVSKAFGM